MVQCGIRMHRRETSACPFHLRMTVRAQNRAFSRLLAAALEASSHAGLGQPERLRRWVAMVELQGGGRPVVSASVACTAGLGDERSLDSPPPLGSILVATATAAIAALRSGPDELGGAVPLAVADKMGGAVALGVERVPPPVGSQVVRAKPMADRRRAAFDFLGDGSNRESAQNQRLQPLARDRALCRVALRMRRLETVLVGPVRDRRRVAADQA